MSIELSTVERTPPIVEVVITGFLRRSDYEKFEPMIEEFADDFGEVNLLIHFVGLQGWRSAGWEDVRCGNGCLSDIHKVAVVCEARFQGVAEAYCRKFSNASISVFAPNHLRDARHWIRQGVVDDVVELCSQVPGIREGDLGTRKR